MFTRFLLTVLLAAMLTPICVAEEVKIDKDQTWSGKVPDNTLKALAPSNGFVADAEQWKKLWTAWRPKEDLPEIDFDKQIVLVGVVSGPNLVMMRPMMNEGNIGFMTASTKMAGPGFGYRMIAVAKEGVKKVNGNPIDAPPMAGGKKDIVKEIPDSIHVRMIGELHSGIVAIGGETTGTTITAQGLTWELDFGDNAEFRKLAETLDGQQVRVAGSLKRRAGVEIKDRWILTVERFAATK
ncbi:hypothetical protein [Blastopirellula marina]|uniref:Uncharacterized protein n=1 Tax=Blastopirellula marina TaxID=124 RepID=A0A2S8GF73_9BACT|nr:hypothetical protein [Blastopirellula marina]PQO43073.1 hypothetical protein C5Y93_25520 [Blastopirellula marina]